jgi:hypothetical protein
MPSHFEADKHSRELPPIAAIHARAERCHWFIGRPSLSLLVADLLLFAFAACEFRAYAIFLLRHHSVIHILFLQVFILLPALFRL